jgi:hypothetical protein
MTVAHLGDSVSGPSGCSRNRAIHVSKVQNEHVIVMVLVVVKLGGVVSNVLRGNICCWEGYLMEEKRWQPLD